jgi:predicted nucleic acid-binding Zn finger protein
MVPFVWFYIPFKTWIPKCISADYELQEILKRIERAYDIVELNKQEPIIIQEDNNKQQIFEVRSMKDKDKFYEVNADIKTCTCPDFNFRLLKCKHIIATEFAVSTLQDTSSSSSLGAAAA